jgi:3-oxoacyl-(acyl-carrier-protein) synthase
VVCGVDALVEFQQMHGHLLGHLHADPRPLTPLSSQGLRGTLPGEGAAAFILAAPDAAAARLARIVGVRSGGPATRNPVLDVHEECRFLEQALGDFGVPLQQVGLLLLGANGDSALDPTYLAVASTLRKQTAGGCVGVYRHLTGDFATASALGLALAVQAIAGKTIPDTIRLVEGTASAAPSCVVLYHLTTAGYHSVMVVSP